MFVFDLLFALIVAFVLTGIFWFGVGRYAVGAGLLMFFLILFLATWAGGIWILPVGPQLFDVSWLVFLITGLIVALILSAVMPPARKAERGTAGTLSGSASTAFTAFFWILLAVLSIAILIAYL